MGTQPRADTAWWQTDGVQPPRPYKGVVRTSRYLTMRDGVNIAIDLCLPEDLRGGDKLPAVLHQTRYFRRMDTNAPFKRLAERRDLMRPLIHRLVENGYAIVNVDVRGTGASFGSRRMEWSPEEVKDGAQIVDWIIGQPWSSGAVASWGISYMGMAAEMLLRNRHPAVKAAIPQYALFDLYADILCPGGVRNETFLRTWAELNAAMDGNVFASFARQHIGILAGMSIKGVAPVDEDASMAMLQAAVEAHKANYDIYQMSLGVECRDDRAASGISPNDSSPHAFMREIEASRAPIYSWSGWYDGAWTLSAIERFVNVKTPGSRLILGPWDHGALQNPDPFVAQHRTRFDHVGEMLRFLNYHLKGMETGIEGEQPVHYFTMGQEAWKSADTWPPPGFEPTPFYFSEDRALRLAEPPAEDGADIYQVDYSASSGRASRWVSTTNLKQASIGYPDRKQQDARLLVYTSAPLEQDIEVTGHPVTTLFVRSTARDGQFFVYLEDVTPRGDVYYVTEGVFRALHRRVSQKPPPYQVMAPYHSFRRADVMTMEPGQVTELAFQLQPISYLFQKGHSIRVAIAGADRDNFAMVPSFAPVIQVLRSPAHPSHILLPMTFR